MRERLNKLMKKAQSERGQGMTEYIVIVGVIAILLIVVAYRYGGSVAELFNSAEAEMSETAGKLEGASGEVSQY